MTKVPHEPDLAVVEDMIRTIRGQKVILDRDLAVLYGIQTYRLNEAVKRNRRRFPEDLGRTILDFITQYG